MTAAHSRSDVISSSRTANIQKEALPTGRASEGIKRCNKRDEGLEEWTPHSSRHIMKATKAHRQCSAPKSRKRKSDTLLSSEGDASLGGVSLNDSSVKSVLLLPSIEECKYQSVVPQNVMSLSEFIDGLDSQKRHSTGNDVSLHVDTQNPHPIAMLPGNHDLIMPHQLDSDRAGFAVHPVLPLETTGTTDYIMGGQGVASTWTPLPLPQGQATKRSKVFKAQIRAFVDSLAEEAASVLLQPQQELMFEPDSSDFEDLLANKAEADYGLEHSMITPQTNVWLQQD